MGSAFPPYSCQCGQGPPRLAQRVPRRPRVAGRDQRAVPVPVAPAGFACARVPVPSLCAGAASSPPALSPVRLAVGAGRGVQTSAASCPAPGPLVTQPSVPLRFLRWAAAGMPRRRGGGCGCKLAVPVAPSRQGRGSCSQWLPSGTQGSGNSHQGVFAWFIKPQRSVFQWPPATPLALPSPGEEPSSQLAARHGVRGAALACGHGNGLPLAAGLEGVLTGACPPLGWSKTSHPSETPEDNDGWSSTEEPVNSSDAEEEGRVGPGKLVTWAPSWPATPRCTLGGRGPRGSSQCLPSVSSHEPALPCRGALLTLRVHLHRSI